MRKEVAAVRKAAPIKKAAMKKALVALPDELWDVIDRDLGDTMGRGYSDTIRGIVTAWLSEQGYLTKGGKNAEQK